MNYVLCYYSTPENILNLIIIFVLLIQIYEVYKLIQTLKK